MAKVWVLDTSTKGTGATMVPLEKILRKPQAPGPIYVPPPRVPAEPPAPEPRRPRAFKVVDIMTRQVLAEDATAQATIEVLNGVRSIVDVNVYVWQPTTETWRLVSFEERRVLWDARTTADGPASVGA
jgi:hypothetical protein